MKRIFLLGICSTAILLASGCASTVTVDRAKAFTEASKDYTDNMRRLNSAVSERIIDHAAETLMESPPPLRTKVYLDETLESLKQSSESATKLAKFFKGLGLYFEELGKLANGSEEEAVTKAADGLVSAINSVGTGNSLSDAKKSAISGLLGQIAKARHSAKLESQLKKDALVVAEAIESSGNILTRFSKSLSQRSQLDKTKLRTREVEPLYVDASGASKLDATWKARFIKLATPTPEDKLVTSGLEAQEALSKGWSALLSGDYSLSELRVVLKDVKEALDAIKSIKEAK